MYVVVYCYVVWCMVYGGSVGGGWGLGEGSSQAVALLLRRAAAGHGPARWCLLQPLYGREDIGNKLSQYLVHVWVCGVQYEEAVVALGPAIS